MYRCMQILMDITCAIMYFCELVIMANFMCQSDIWLNITIDVSVRLLLGGTYIKSAEFLRQVERPYQLKRVTD